MIWGGESEPAEECDVGLGVVAGEKRGVGDGMRSLLLFNMGS